MMPAMPRKPPRPRKTSDPEQLKRFIDMAREVGVDESPAAFDRAFAKVVGSAKKKAPPAKPD
jgi:hypothetical protein